MSKVDVEETEKGFVFSWILAVMDNTICGILCRGKFFFFATQTMFGNEFRCMRKNKSFQSLGTQHVRCVIKAYFLLHSSVKKGSELPQYWKVILITINWFSIIFTQKEIFCLSWKHQNTPNFFSFKKFLYNGHNQQERKALNWIEQLSLDFVKTQISTSYLPFAVNLIMLNPKCCNEIVTSNCNFLFS